LERVATTVTVRQNEFESIAMPHSRSLLRVARRLIIDPAAAEDLVQETFLRAWRSFDQFERGTNVRAWLFRILFNAFYAQGRKTRSTPVLVSLDPFGREAEVPGPRGFSILDVTGVARAFQELSDEHQSVLLLGVVEGFTCREAAEILSVPIGTVMSRLSRARRALRDRIESAGPKARGAACAGKEAS
jgi:RNA polymerase sigma-70 factor (ECF subfamily)